MISGLFAVIPFAQGIAFASTPDFGMLYYKGDTVHTTIPPSASAKGLDDIYVVTNGVSGQLGIASVAPGDKDYHGGHWILNTVTFNVAPYLLTSESDVLAAEAVGDVTVTTTQDYFLCPIQPH